VSVERRLREFTAPEEAGAAERARALAGAAFADREPVTRAGGGRRLAMAAALGVLAAGAVAAPGGAVDWVRDLVRPDPPTPRRAPALTALPAPGRLLVTGPGGAWVVQGDGSARRLGSYEDATWSPRGLFVGAAEGRTLSALEPDGTVRWTLTRREPVSRPAWAPSGYRIAYRSGPSLRVVAGDGSGDRSLAARAGAAAPAWRPGRSRNQLAYARPDGAVVLRDVDSARRIWTSARGAAPVALAWTDRGRRLAVVRDDLLILLDADGRVARRQRLPGDGVGLAPVAGNRALIVSVAGADGTGRVLRVPAHRGGARTLLAAPGSIRELVSSPDGGTVLAARPGAGEWVFLPLRRGEATAVSGIARQFDPRPARARGMPVVRGWSR
jgi:dipeptidyl aminopeptidase/acylaminoacyl peptidase